MILVFALNALPVFSATTGCPTNLTDAQCLEYLRQKAADIKRQGQQLSEDLSNERYQQLSLSQQIAYMQNKIRESEQQIEEMEVDLETKNVEIKILTDEIDKTTEKVETIIQEKVKLENSINKSVSISYKYSFMGPIELLVKGSSFDTIFRKMKYLVESRRNDKDMLEDMKSKEVILDQEEKVLAENKLSLEQKRKEVEENKVKLFEEKETLAAQQSTYAILLEQSQAKEDALLAELEKNRVSQASLDNAIIQYIQSHSNLMVNSGYVPAGALIGRMGNTGLSYGAHLHFSVGTSNSVAGYGNVSPWAGYLNKGPGYWAQSGGWTYYYITGGSFLKPLSGSIILTQDYHQGYAVDLVSLDGEGAFVYAVMEGTLYKGTDLYGGRYAVIVHPNGLKTTYLHLQ